MATNYSASDDAPLFIVRRDLSGGQNTRQDEQILGENQCTVLQNVDLSVAGQRSIRKGATLVQDLGTTVGTGIFGFEPEGGTNQLIANSGEFIKWWAGSGSFLSIASLASIGFDQTMRMMRALESDQGDVVLMSNGTDNVLRLEPNTPAFQDLGDTNTSPPKSLVMTYFRDRAWFLKDEKLSYSGAVPSDYSNTFNRSSNYFNIPVGTERALYGTRDYGLIIFGSKGIYQLNPSIVPDPAQDKPEFVLDIGCVNGNTVKPVADDFFYLAYDGVRALRRTVQDKLQSGQSYPISWNLKEEFEDINWAYIHKADAVYFDNKYILTLPTVSSTYNNKIWVYYPAMNSWSIITGLNIGYFATIKINNEERLYGIDATDGSVYRLFNGTSDNETAIVYQEEGRAEDFSNPLVYKNGGEFKLKVKGSGATITPYGSPDGAGYTPLTGDSIVLPSGGLNFPLSFPFSFAITEATGVWHLDGLGRFKRLKFKIYCATKDAEVTILESIATTFAEEYLSEE